MVTAVALIAQQDPLGTVRLVADLTRVLRVDVFPLIRRCDRLEFLRGSRSFEWLDLSGIVIIGFWREFVVGLEERAARVGRDVLEVIVALAVLGVRRRRLPLLVRLGDLRLLLLARVFEGFVLAAAVLLIFHLVLRRFLVAALLLLLRLQLHLLQHFFFHLPTLGFLPNLLLRNPTRLANWSFVLGCVDHQRCIDVLE